MDIYSFIDLFVTFLFLFFLICVKGSSFYPFNIVSGNIVLCRHCSKNVSGVYHVRIVVARKRFCLFSSLLFIYSFVG